LLSKYRYSRSVLLEMAITAEESAKEFYTALGQRFSEHAGLFNQLAKDEEGHATAYKQLLSGEEVYSTQEERMLADYNIQALETSSVVGSLRRGAERARTAPDFRSALQAAVEMEKDTLLLYHSMSMAAGKTDRQEIYKIIRVEHSHLARVESLAK